MDEERNEQKVVGSEEAKVDPAMIEYLTNVINNLKERIVLLEGRDVELKETRKQLNQSENARNELNCCLKESGNKILSESKLTASFKDTMIMKNKDLMTENRILRDGLQKIEGEKVMLESQLITLKNYVSIVDLEVKTLRDTIASEEDIARLLKKINTLFEESKEKNALVLCFILVDYRKIKERTQ